MDKTIVWIEDNTDVKERARQQKKHDKAQRRLAAKVQSTSSTPRLEDDELERDGKRPAP